MPFFFFRVVLGLLLLRNFSARLGDMQLAEKSALHSIQLYRSFALTLLPRTVIGATDIDCKEKKKEKKKKRTKCLRFEDFQERR
jgi:hypothetical protein